MDAFNNGVKIKTVGVTPENSFGAVIGFLPFLQLHLPKHLIF